MASTLPYHGYNFAKEIFLISDVKMAFSLLNMYYFRLEVCFPWQNVKLCPKLSILWRRRMKICEFFGFSRAYTFWTFWTQEISSKNLEKKKCQNGHSGSFLDHFQLSACLSTVFIYWYCIWSLWGHFQYQTFRIWQIYGQWVNFVR